MLNLSKGNVVLAYIRFYNRTAKVSDEREVRIELEELPAQVEKEGTKINILQGKLDEFPGGYVRVRKETPGGYTLTRKVFNEHNEDTMDISEKLFTRLFKSTFDQQDKERIKWNGWDIDLIDGGKKIVAEFEMPEGQKHVDVPSIFKMTKTLEGTVTVSPESST